MLTPKTIQAQKWWKLGMMYAKLSAVRNQYTKSNIDLQQKYE